MIERNNNVVEFVNLVRMQHHGRWSGKWVPARRTSQIHATLAAFLRGSEERRRSRGWRDSMCGYCTVSDMTRGSIEMYIQVKLNEDQGDKLKHYKDITDIQLTLRM